MANGALEHPISNDILVRSDSFVIFLNFIISFSDETDALSETEYVTIYQSTYARQVLSLLYSYYIVFHKIISFFGILKTKIHIDQEYYVTNYRFLCHNNERSRSRLCLNLCIIHSNPLLTQMKKQITIYSIQQFAKKCKLF